VQYGEKDRVVRFVVYQDSYEGELRGAQRVSRSRFLILPSPASDHFTHHPTRLPNSLITKPKPSLLASYPSLHPFESAQLSNLLPLTAIEAKNVIPTLEKWDDGELQMLLDYIWAIVGNEGNVGWGMSAA